MAQPPAYNRNKNFTEDFGTGTDHSALNAELDRASNSINDIRANLAILQADDGKLRPSVVTSDSLSAELIEYVIDQATSGAATYANVASSSAAAAAASEAHAASSEEEAASSRDRAASSAEAAAHSESKAAVSEANAAKSAGAADTSASLAAASQEQAAVSAGQAAGSAQDAITLFTSLETVQEAVREATESAKSASVAETNVTEAEFRIRAAETNAVASAAVADASQAEAAVSEANAAKSALSADASAEAAGQSAVSASQSASLAQSYANQAAVGQVNADWEATSGKGEILNKPTLFPPEAHTHGDNDILVPPVNKGIVEAGSTVTFSFADGEFQTATFQMGPVTIAIDGYDETRRRSMMLQLNGAGLIVLTFPAIYWVVPDGTYTTNLATYLEVIGRAALSSTMPTWILVWQVGSIVYGKML